jgi:hypothetical protein
VSSATPFWAVTTVKTVFDPTFNAMGLDAEPLDTVLLLTVMVELAWLAVGVTVTLVTLLETLSV